MVYQRGTLRASNVAIDTPPFMDVPLFSSMYRGVSIAAFGFQRANAAIFHHLNEWLVVWNMFCHGFESSRLAFIFLAIPGWLNPTGENLKGQPILAEASSYISNMVSADLATKALDV